MPYADPADRLAYQRAYRNPNYDRVIGYQRKYLAKNRERIYRKAREWRERNLSRARAHDRLRYLRSKRELTCGEIEQCAEICAKHPKRRENIRC